MRVRGSSLTRFEKNGSDNVHGMNWWLEVSEGREGGGAGGFERCPSKNRVHPGPQNVTSFRNRVFETAMSSDEVTLNEGGPRIQ